MGDTVGGKRLLKMKASIQAWDVFQIALMSQAQCWVLGYSMGQNPQESSRSWSIGSLVLWKNSFDVILPGGRRLGEETPG